MYNNNTFDSLKNLTLKNISRSKKEKGSFPWEIKRRSASIGDKFAYIMAKLVAINTLQLYTFLFFELTANK